MKKLFVVALSLFSVVALSACNTMEGLGEDTQAAGKSLERSAERNN